MKLIPLVYFLTLATMAAISQAAPIERPLGGSGSDPFPPEDHIVAWREVMTSREALQSALELYHWCSTQVEGKSVSVLPYI